MTDTTLYIFSGLPGTGKSTLARLLSSARRATYVRVDTVEQAMMDLCDFNPQGEGYGMAYRLVEDNLILGNSAVADSCNPVALTRLEWEQVARSCGAMPVNIEILCSDRHEHKKRVQARFARDQSRHPDWHQVVNREYEKWQSDIVTVDTAGLSVEQSFERLCSGLENAQPRIMG